MNTREKLIGWALAAVAAIGLSALLLSATTWGAKPGGSTLRYSIVPLDTRPGYQWSYASDVNEKDPNGKAVVVGYVEDANGNVDAVAWEVTVSGGAASIVERILPGGFDESAAFGVNDQGEIVGSSVRGGVYEQALYWEDAASTPLLLPPLSGDSYCMATSINNDGVVVGSSWNATPASKRAVAWKVGPAGNLLAGSVSLGILIGGEFSVAGDVGNTDVITGNVRVVGDSGSAGGLRATLWEIDADTLAPVSGPVSLGVLGSDVVSSGLAINDQGTTCGYSQGVSRGPLAFRKPYGGAMQQLAQLKPGQTYAYGINNRNEAVGTNRHQDPRTGAFLGTYAVMWQADGKVVNLGSFIGSSGWYYVENPRAINESGWIAGHGASIAIGEPGESRALVMIPK